MRTDREARDTDKREAAVCDETDEREVNAGHVRVIYCFQSLQFVARCFHRIVVTACTASVHPDLRVFQHLIGGELEEDVLV